MDFEDDSVKRLNLFDYNAKEEDESINSSFNNDYSMM
jgi:hypothetical protein